MSSGLAKDLFEMTKPRICLLALMMAALGFFLGSKGPIPPVTFVLALVGTALVGAACGALNMYLERDIDALMWRTMDRPLPSGRVPPRYALILGFSAAILGELILLVGVNPITAVLGAVTAFFYLGIYTPSKRVSSLSTLIGAIPGALPPLMGFTAAHGRIAAPGLWLFAILFLWQIPHFLAIAWIYREDYARGGFPILSVVDEAGLMTAKQILLYSLVLLPLTLVPSVWGITGGYYFGGALLLGAFFFVLGAKLAFRRNHAHARALFLYSILYLPALGLLLVWDRVF
jgi:heme o synthase